MKRKEYEIEKIVLPNDQPVGCGNLVQSSHWLQGISQAKRKKLMLTSEIYSKIPQPGSWLVYYQMVTIFIVHTELGWEGGGGWLSFHSLQFFHASGHRIHHIIIGKGYGGLPWPQTKEKKVAKQKKPWQLIHFGFYMCLIFPRYVKYRKNVNIESFLLNSGWREKSRR